MTAPMGNQSALIYCRVSTKRQEDEGTSLDSQEAACIKHAESLGYAVARVTREVYSGAELWDRPLLTEDREAIRAGTYQALIFYALDRLSRDPIHQAIVAEECERRGVEFISVTEDFDKSAEGGLIRYVRGYSAKIEREKIRERNMRGKHARVHAGNVPRWGFPLYGYRLAEKPIEGDPGGRTRTVREVYEPEAAIVRRMFRWSAEDGMGLTAIAKRLNQEGVPTPSAGKRKTDPAAPASRWGTTQVQRILRRTEYKGEGYALTRAYASGVDPVKLPDDATPAIVPAATWQAVQDRLDRNGAPVRADRRDSWHQYLLRGFIYCAECGRPMRSSPDHARFIYRCSSRETPEGACRGKAVRANDAMRLNELPRDPKTKRILPVDAQTREQMATLPGVDRLVWEAVVEVLRQPATIREALERQQHDGPDPVLVDDLAAARRALAQVDQKQQRLIRQFSESTDDSFPWELVRNQIATLETDKKQIQTTVDELEARLAHSQTETLNLAALVGHLEELSSQWGERLASATPEQKRLVLETLKIEVYATGTETPQVWSPYPAIAGAVSPQYRSSASPMLPCRKHGSGCGPPSRTPAAGSPITGSPSTWRPLI